MSSYWEVHLERGDQVVATLTGLMDPFVEILPLGPTSANVGCTYKRALQDYGKESLSFNVQVTCCQDEATINRAGELVMLKVLEMLGQGTELLARLEEEASKK